MEKGRKEKRITPRVNWVGSGAIPGNRKHWKRVKWGDHEAILGVWSLGSLWNS